MGLPVKLWGNSAFVVRGAISSIWSGEISPLQIVMRTTYYKKTRNILFVQITWFRFQTAYKVLLTNICAIRANVGCGWRPRYV